MSEEHNFLHHITGSFSQPAAENPTVKWSKPLIAIMGCITVI